MRAASRAAVVLIAATVISSCDNPGGGGKTDVPSSRATSLSAPGTDSIPSSPATLRPSTATPASSSPMTASISSEALPGKWGDRTLVISSQGLGAVQIGMSFEEAGVVAGVKFRPVGDGVSNPIWSRPPSFPYLYMHSAPGFPVACVGAAGDSSKQVIITPEGLRLGDSSAKVRTLYGSRAHYEPKPMGGRDPRPGYVVYEHGGDLVFKVDDANTTVNAIVGGPAQLTPSQCAG